MAFPSHSHMRTQPPVPIEETETAPLLGHSSEDTSQDESHHVLWNLVTGKHTPSTYSIRAVYPNKMVQALLV